MDVTLSEQIEKLSADLNAAQTLVNESNEKSQALNADNESLKASLAAINEEKEKLNASIVERDAQIKDLSEMVGKLQSEAKSAEDKAVEIMASMGVPAAKVSNNETPETMTNDQLWEQYHAIKDPKEKAIFYRKNISK